MQGFNCFMFDIKSKNKEESKKVVIYYFNLYIGANSSFIRYEYFGNPSWSNFQEYTFMGENPLRYSSTNIGRKAVKKS